MELIILALVLAGAGYAIYRSSRKKNAIPPAPPPSDEAEKPVKGDLR